jgi:hypothetical protein
MWFINTAHMQTCCSMLVAVTRIHSGQYCSRSGRHGCTLLWQATVIICTSHLDFGVTRGVNVTPYRRDVCHDPRKGLSFHGQVHNTQVTQIFQKPTGRHNILCEEGCPSSTPSTDRQQAPPYNIWAPLRSFSRRRPGKFALSRGD